MAVASKQCHNCPTIFSFLTFLSKILKQSFEILSLCWANLRILILVEEFKAMFANSSDKSGMRNGWTKDFVVVWKSKLCLVLENFWWNFKISPILKEEFLHTEKMVKQNIKGQLYLNYWLVFHKRLKPETVIGLDVGSNRSNLRTKEICLPTVNCRTRQWTWVWI